MKSFRNQLINILLALGGVVVAYSMVELAAITTGFLVSQNFKDRHRWFHEFLEPDDKLGFKPRANLEDFRLSWMEESVSEIISTDEFGFRNAQRDYSSSEIFFIGDSFTWGAWVQREDTFYGLVEEQLSKPVITLGVGGYGIQQYKTLFDEFAKNYQPRLVVLCIFANDLIPLTSTFENYYQNVGWTEYESLPWYKKTLSYRIFSRSRMSQKNNHEGAYRQERQQASNGLTLYRQRGASATYLKKGENIKVENVLSQIIDAAKDENIELLIFLFPSKESAYLHEYQHLFPGDTYLRNEEEGYQRLCRLAAKEQTSCVDLTELFRQHAKDGVVYFPLDPHWNEAGHELAGSEILRQIRKELP